MPMAFPLLFKSSMDWDLAGEPEPGWAAGACTCRAASCSAAPLDQRDVYVRGRPLDYDLWSASGATGWAWDAVRPLLPQGRGEQRARRRRAPRVGGPLRVEDLRSPQPWTRRGCWRRRAAPAPRNADYNGPAQDGVAPVPGDPAGPPLDHGGRLPAPGPAPAQPDRPLPAHTDTGILAKGGRATGVGATGPRGAGQRRTPTARCSSPPARWPPPSSSCSRASARPSNLRADGVDVVHDLPGVGGGLQDHPGVVPAWSGTCGRASRCSGLESPFKGQVHAQVVGASPRPADLQPRRGVLLCSPARTPSCPYPDLQFHFSAG